jgi:hypothetical protein
MLKLKETSEKLDQYQHETSMWIRSLDFFKQENNHLKNRLTEVVDKTSDKYFLAQAEHFQNQFIIKDEFMDELRHDINDQTKRLKEHQRKNQYLNGQAANLTELQTNLREQIHYLEKDFTSLRNEFHHYLTQQIWT